MKLITIVALLGISTHALAAIPVPTAQVDEERLEQPRLRGFDPDFFEDLMMRGHDLETCTSNWCTEVKLTDPLLFHTTQQVPDGRLSFHGMQVELQVSGRELPDAQVHA
eukprot:scaffold1593_cov154-Skeletonema_dohrnii-CCMP3373.AAC.12